jgi:hypothetical protein
VSQAVNISVMANLKSSFHEKIKQQTDQKNHCSSKKSQFKQKTLERPKNTPIIFTNITHFSILKRPICIKSSNTNLAFSSLQAPKMRNFAT